MHIDYPLFPELDPPPPNKKNRVPVVIKMYVSNYNLLFATLINFYCKVQILRVINAKSY